MRYALDGLRKFGAGLAVAALLPLAAPAWADSPLTSADFSRAYLDLPQVKKAAAKGLLDDELADYLLSPGTAYDEAAAVINALGWDTDGKDNHLRLLRRLKATQPQAYARFKSGKGSTRALFVVGYLWAMDNYFKTDKAEALLWLAHRQAPEYFAIALVHALVQAQGRDADEWCEVFRGPRQALARYSNGLEMRRKAVDQVFEYTDIYSDSCK